MIGNIDLLVKELCKLPKEVGWVEFKHNNCEPTMVGEENRSWRTGCVTYSLKMLILNTMTQTLKASMWS